MANISSIIKAIQDIMRKDTGVDGDAQRLSQIVWLLFLKIYADKEEEYEILDDNYKSPIPNDLRWKNWALDDEGITSDVLIDFVNNKLLPTLKELEGNDQADLISEIFKDTYNYMKSGILLRQVINKINEIDFNSKEDRHLFNDIYEQLLQSLQSAGNAGEYYTPRAVTKFIVEMVNPQLGEKVLDPANGTGGFLSCSIEHLRKQVKTNADSDTLNNSIFGIEKKPLPYQLCTTNMILHGIDTPKKIKLQLWLSYLVFSTLFRYYDKIEFMNNKHAKIVIIVFLPLLAVGLANLLVRYYPHTICLWKNIFHNNCWGCGITRAFCALCKFDFISAWQYNPRIYIVVPILLYVWLYNIYKLLYKS